MVDTTTTTEMVDTTTTTESVVVQNVRVRARETLAVVSWDALEGADGYTVRVDVDHGSRRGEPNWDRRQRAGRVRHLNHGATAQFRYATTQFRVGATNMDDSWSGSVA